MAKKQIEDNNVGAEKSVPTIDLSSEVIVVGTGKNKEILKDEEYLVSGDTANVLIKKGFVKQK